MNDSFSFSFLLFCFKRLYGPDLDKWKTTKTNTKPKIEQNGSATCNLLSSQKAPQSQPLDGRHLSPPSISPICVPRGRVVNVNLRFRWVPFLKSFCQSHDFLARRRIGAHLTLTYGTHFASLGSLSPSTLFFFLPLRPTLLHWDFSLVHTHFRDSTNLFCEVYSLLSRTRIISLIVHTGWNLWWRFLRAKL